jgi:hypothetical protein
LRTIVAHGANRGNTVLKTNPSLAKGERKLTPIKIARRIESHVF